MNKIKDLYKNMTNSLKEYKPCWDYRLIEYGWNIDDGFWAHGNILYQKEYWSTFNAKFDNDLNVTLLEIQNKEF